MPAPRPLYHIVSIRSMQLGDNVSSSPRGTCYNGSFALQRHAREIGGHFDVKIRLGIAVQSSE